MSLVVSVMQEYISKLSSCLLSLQHDQHGAARQTLDRWNAEARALVCCVRAYNPKALKALETSTLNENDALPAPGRQLFQQQLVRGLHPASHVHAFCYFTESSCVLLLLHRLQLHAMSLEHVHHVP